MLFPKQILAWLAEGLSDNQIAGRLSVRTAKGHWAGILEKPRGNIRSALIRFALQSSVR